MRIVFFFCFILSFSIGQAQFGVGTWRDHLPYANCIDVCDGGDVVYAATPYSVFFFDREDNSVNRLSRVEGLAEAQVSSIAYSAENNVLIVGYVNGNIDFVFDESRVVNLSDLKNSTIPADKTINEIYFDQDKAYLACGFGIVVVDINKNEISDTYLIGDNTSYVFVNDILIIDDLWYAATENGIYTADVGNPFLVSFESWSLVNDLPAAAIEILNIEVNSQRIYLFTQSPADLLPRIFFKDRVPGAVWEEWSDYKETEFSDIFVDEEYVITSDTYRFFAYDLDHNIEIEKWQLGGKDVRAQALIRDQQGIFWIADRESGLLGDNYSTVAYRAIPDGPYGVPVRRMDAYNFNVWAAGGGVNASFTSLFNGTGVYSYVDEVWGSQRVFENQVIPDFMDVAINPLDNSEVYAGSWHKGLVRYKNGELTDVFNESNSTLELSTIEGALRVGVGATNFDINGNLWFSSHRQNEVLHLRTPNGNFYAYDLSPLLDASDVVLDILATQAGYVWVITRNNGILVLDHKGTLTDQNDDELKLLSTDEGNGALPSSEVLSIEEDLDGEVWIGTNAGPAVFYSQEAIFTDNNFDCQQIFITQDGNVQILLETESITAIELDGGNRKWIGTLNSGVYLLSDDGLTQEARFTEENSPLLSNSISDIAINQENGEVFIATSKGIIGYKNDATNFYENMKDLIRVYPNPVYPDYDGLISIDNLARDADVKISDISGNVVYETIANGGRATWDGRKLNGEKVSTGVYMIFAATGDGTSKGVTKVAFIK